MVEVFGSVGPGHLPVVRAPETRRRPPACPPNRRSGRPAAPSRIGPNRCPGSRCLDGVGQRARAREIADLDVDRAPRETGRRRPPNRAGHRRPAPSAKSSPPSRCPLRRRRASAGRRAGRTAPGGSCALMSGGAPSWRALVAGVGHLRRHGGPVPTRHPEHDQPDQDHRQRTGHQPRPSDRVGGAGPAPSRIGDRSAPRRERC